MILLEGPIRCDYCENGYRLYGEEALLRLQQILFFRELDFSLNEIRDMLDRPGFDMEAALALQREALANRVRRLTGLIETIDNTMRHLKGETTMSAENLFAGFDEARNKGYDIAGKAGDPVLAAADGRVVYAGAGLRGYGNLVILKHNNTFLTAYAHNQTLLVKEDQSVRKGQKIAEMGNTDADRVKLHFEIRRQGKPVDPTRYLPPR